MNFNDFAGNEHLIAQLKNVIRNNKILNSYVFSGNEGIGKKTLSSLFINTIFCQAPKNDGACGNCSSCKQIKSDNHPDIIYLTKQKDKKTIGIDEIREQIIKQVYIKPFIASRKFFVITDGDILTTEAQNGLLKVLEEPPEYVTFIILVTKTSRLLDTVLSRSCVLNLHPVTKEEIVNYLKNTFSDAPISDINFSANFSQGIIGKAVKVLTDEEYKSLFFDISRFMTDLLKSKKSLVSFHRYLLDNKDDIDTIIDFMLIYLRDGLLLCEGLKEMMIYPESYNDISISQNDKKKYALCMDSVIKYKNTLPANVNFTVLTLDLLTEIQKKCYIN